MEFGTLHQCPVRCTNALAWGNGAVAQARHGNASFDPVAAISVRRLTLINHLEGLGCHALECANPFGDRLARPTAIATHGVAPRM